MEGMSELLKLSPKEREYVLQNGLVARWARVHGSDKNQARVMLYKQAGYEPLPEGLRRRMGDCELYVTKEGNAQERDKQKEQYNKSKMQRYRSQSAEWMDKAARETRGMRPIGHIDDVDFDKKQRLSGKGTKIPVGHPIEEE